jgi:competence protein ComEA
MTKNLRNAFGILLVVSLLAPVAASAAGSAGTVNVNTATVEQLQLLPRIGPSVAQRILDYRKENGKFGSLDDLMLVRGIGEAPSPSSSPTSASAATPPSAHKVKVSRGSKPAQAAAPRKPRSPSPSRNRLCSHRGGALVPRPAFFHSSPSCTQPSAKETLMSTQRGFQLVELVVVLALISMAALIVVPPVLSLSAPLRVDLAAHELRRALPRRARWRSGIAPTSGIKFYPAAGRVTYACYRDGDGDGVRSADIVAGVDPQVTPLRTVSHLGGRVGFGFPPGRRRAIPATPAAASTGSMTPSASTTPTSPRTARWARRRRALSTSPTAAASSPWCACSASPARCG